MKRALCLLATFLFILPVLAQNPEDRISLQKTPASFQNHRLLLTSNAAEDSKEQSLQKTRSKKRSTKSEAPQNGTRHIYKTIG